MPHVATSMPIVTARRRPGGRPRSIAALVLLATLLLLSAAIAPTLGPALLPQTRSFGGEPHPGGLADLVRPPAATGSIGAMEATTRTLFLPIACRQRQLKPIATNQIGGAISAIAGMDDVAYVASGPRLIAVDTADKSEPRHSESTPAFEDLISDVTASDDVAYLACGNAGLIVVGIGGGWWTTRAQPARSAGESAKDSVLR